jgi:hypothetical protein
VSAVPLLQQDRPDAPFLEMFDSYARGEVGLEALMMTIDVCLAAGDWTGHRFERQRLERFKARTVQEWQASAYAWRVAYGIKEGSGA